MNAPALLPAVLDAENRVADEVMRQEQLANQITLLAGQINAANHRLLTLIAEFDCSKGWSGGGTVRSCAHWLNWKCGIALGAAREKVRVAHCLAALPLIDGAFASGEISYSKARADALVEITETFLANSGSKASFSKLKGSERCQIMLHVDMNTLREQHSEHSYDHCHLESGQWLSRSTARRLACDASLVTVLEDEQGQVLNIGRRSRTVPPAISRALTLRDKSCRVPSCCESRFVDAHHIKHWADGGETSLENLVTLCRYHHRLLHRGCFDIRAEKADRKSGALNLMFSMPSGEELQECVYPQFPDVSAETFAAQWQELAPGVGAHTCVTAWRGEGCDYGMAVDGVLRRSRSGSLF